MAGISFTVTLEDDAPRLALARMGEAMDDMTELMDGVGRALVNSGVERIISTNTDPDGAAWTPSRRVQEHGGRTLHLSGLLGNSLTHQAAADHVVVGSNLIYAAVMHEGAEQGAFGAAVGRTRPTEKRPRSQDYFTPLPWGDIPARRYLATAAGGISEEDELTVGDLVEVHFGAVAEGLQ